MLCILSSLAGQRNWHTSLPLRYPFLFSRLFLAGRSSDLVDEFEFFLPNDARMEHRDSERRPDSVACFDLFVPVFVDCVIFRITIIVLQ